MQSYDSPRDPRPRAAATRFLLGEAAATYLLRFARTSPSRLHQVLRKPATTLAVVDLGSNSFRLEVGRVEGDQVYQLDTWRETLRLGAGFDANGRLKPAAMRDALACLARFRERLSGLHPSAVRVVATNAFRVAKNAREFLARAERAIGLPIDVISGHEEARLTYFGVAHELPPSPKPRLVIDIGGGSTEFIIGRSLEPDRLESLKIGCVGMTQRFFRRRDHAAGFRCRRNGTARVEIEAIARGFGPTTGGKPMGRPVPPSHWPTSSSKRVFRRRHHAGGPCPAETPLLAAAHIRG